MRKVTRWSWTGHAVQRAVERGISKSAVEAALRWGCPRTTWRDWLYEVDGRSVEVAASQGVDIAAHQGVCVVLSADRAVRTAWRIKNYSQDF
jgi:hypothetical protein